MKGILVFLLSSIVCISTYAQVKPIYFIGDQITQDKNEATSYGIYGKLSTEDLWTFKRYDLYDNLIQTGSYADELLTIAHGKFIFYSDVAEFNFLYNASFSLKGKTRFISQEGSFVTGLEQGKWFLFYPDGSVFSVQEFVDGKLNGQMMTYNKFGIAILSGNYVNGLKHGEWLLEKGKIREIYEMGVLKSRENVKDKKVIKGNINSKNNS